jgi:hypothetical protein
VPTNRFGYATQHLANVIHEERYAHHIAAFTANLNGPLEKTQLPSLRKLLKGPDSIIWDRSNANEFGRLLPRGVGKSRPADQRIAGTSTMFPIRLADIPPGRFATYANFVCDIRPNKAEQYRVRLTAGGDRLEFPGDPSSPAVATTDSKIHINSTISDAKKGARYMTMDIKNFFLGTPLHYYQYLRIHESMIPQEIFDEYPELVVESNGYVYFEVRKGIYGLKEAGLMAFQHLVKNLAKHGYEPMKFTPGLWRHRSRPTTFTLCVDDFGAKYFTKEDANHLIAAVKTNYECTIDWSGSLYCGLNLKWNYEQGFVDVSMDGYVRGALKRFEHVPTSSRTQHAPHPWTSPVYGKKTAQQPTTTSTAPPLDKEGTRRIQAINGTFIHYANIDPCIKPALNEIGTVQAAPTTDTNHKVQMLMDYLHDHPDGVL